MLQYRNKYSELTLSMRLQTLINVRVFIIISQNLRYNHHKTAFLNVFSLFRVISDQKHILHVYKRPKCIEKALF